MSLPPSLAAALPGWAVVHELTRDAGQSRVWRVARDEAAAVLKQHRGAGKFARECAALQLLAGQPWAPRLLAVVAAERALLIELRAGTPRIDAASCTQAGAALAALHAMPMADHDPLPIAHALRRRLDGWLARAAGLLPDATLAAIDARFGDGSAFEGDRRVLCHRDFAPRNWLVAGENFTLIDFEHSAPDHPLVDVVRLCDEVFIDRPDLEAAFFAGYGARPDADPDANPLGRLLALHGLATATWGRRHHDAQFITRGDALLTRLGLATDRAP